MGNWPPIPVQTARSLRHNLLNDMKFFYLFTFLFLGVQTLQGQPVTPAQEIRPVLRELSLEQKLKLLEYLRYIGASIDKEISQTYEQVKPEKRKLALQYAEMIQKGEDPMQYRTSVEWSPDTIEFDLIEEGAIRFDSFEVTNTGLRPYIIREIKTSCECTVVRKPDFPIMPGESAWIRIEFDSAGKAGEALAGIIIYDNSSPNLRNILYLHGQISPRGKVKRINSGN